MAKVIIAGQAVVIKSELTLDDIKLIEKVRPNALNLMGGENGKEMLFKVGTTKDDGSINCYGASFNSAASGDGKACITLAAKGIADVPEWVTENLTGPLTKLNKLEQNLPAVLTEVAEEKAAVEASIEVLA